jgi:hypothetical protein
MFRTYSAVRGRAMRATHIPVLTACLLLLGICGASANADIAIIVHPSFPGTGLSKSDFASLYLGRTSTFPGGSQATPIDLASGPVRDQMLSQLLDKTDAQMAHIWSRLVFSGNAKSLSRVADDKAMLERVAKDPSAIGYVDASSVNSSVKVLTLR